ncbi:hypothetical protein MTR67_050886 [Solanum verrucosum]|uniref:Chromo domain-containing protein n=1 Tax=Solanum verrucosum TaxID=315347 RepID=A0AAF0V655_SOLVR|nr:hypothetical protein MTR67_050886 [Solanum verrucosum]
MKGVMRFGKKGKLSPRYIGPYRIAKRIGNVAYELELPQEIAAVHSVFHISMLKKCICDPSLIQPTKSIRIKDNFFYEEVPVRILDRQVRRLRTKDVALVKVLWRNQFVEEATWEAEEDMKKRYPYLFESGGNVDQVQGWDLDKRGFKVLVKEVEELAATLNLGDFFPFLGVIDLQGLTRQLKDLSKVFDEFLEKIIDEHV